MQVSHSLDKVAVGFDDDRLVANAGLIAPASLAEHLGLKDLFDERVDLGDAPGRANVGHKAMTIIHAMLAGADSIDDCEVLRSGATSAVLGHGVAAPSTLGTFLRSFSWAHARQLDSVAGEMLARAWAAGGGPDDPAGRFTIDVDSSVHETYGTQKEGATRFSYTQVRGYHPLYATAAHSGEVLHSRLRGGNSHTARGAASFLAETFARVRTAGVSGPIAMRADSGFYSKKVVDACQAAGVGFSITVKLYKGLLGEISKIPEDAWKPIPYWLEDGADVAELPWQAFGKDEKGVACRLVVRRVKPTPGSQLALIATYSYHAFITCATRRHQPGGVKGPTSGLSQQPAEAESSPTSEARGSGGSSSDNDGTVWHRQTGRARQARRKGVRVQEPVVEPPQARDRLEPGGSGPGSSARPPRWATPTAGRDGR